MAWQMEQLTVSPRALEDIVVVEVGHGVALGYCGALLRACGATLTKVEVSSGDIVRHTPPFAPNTAPPEASGLHAFLSAGKRSVVLDLSTDDGARAMKQLACRADVLLDAMGPGKLQALGLGAGDLQAVNERLTVVSLSWFGGDGHRRDWVGSDAIVQALAGFIYPIGDPAGPPMIPSGFNAQITAGVTAYIATMSALISVRSGDPAPVIDQSVLEAQATYTETSAIRFSYDETPSVRKGLNKFTPTYPQTIYPAADGWIGVTVLTPLQWRECCKLIGANELIDDPRFATSKDRNDRADELEACLVPYFRKRTAAFWFHEGQARRVPLALVPDMHEFSELDHFQERAVLACYEHPDFGGFKAPTVPWKLSATPVCSGGRAPRLGEHTNDVLSALAQSRDVAGAKPVAIPATSQSRKKPLRNVRIVDFTMGWSGPLATRHLADMGAEVVKVEACKYPDWWRGWEHTASSVAANEHEKSPPFNQMNRNKLGVAIDLTRAEGRALALKLIARAHAVIENQATGVMAKLGLSFEELQAVNPSIIMLSLPAFGAVGPWSGYRGYGSTVEHGAGLPHLTGEPDDPPVQTHVAYGDACGGINAAGALLTGLFYRERTGVGQRIELSQVECIMQLGIHGPIAYHLAGGVRRTGRRHPTSVPHGVFPAAGSDNWVVVAVQDDAQWHALCAAMGRADWACDVTLSSAEGRRAREDELEDAIRTWTAQRSADDAMECLQAAGVGAAAVRRASELLTEPGFVERGYWAALERQFIGEKPYPNTPWLYNGERASIEWPSPLLGEHNHEVFCGLLGMSQTAVLELEDAGVIGTKPVV